MIFRRSNDLPQTKNSMQTNQQRMTETPQATPRATYKATTPTTQATQNTAPLSPIALAQARRTQSNANLNNLPSNFSRPEQLRKLTVGRDITLNGEITTCDHLIVEGNVSATIKGGQILEIAEVGAFNGVVDIEQADIAGRFEGNLTVRGKLILRPSAHVTGTIQYGALQVDTGATLNGQITSLGLDTPLKQTFTPNETYTAMDSKPQDQQAQGLAMLNDQPGFLKASA